jgi:hypothetical protein
VVLVGAVLALSWFKLFAWTWIIGLLLAMIIALHRIR